VEPRKNHRLPQSSEAAFFRTMSKAAAGSWNSVPAPRCRRSHRTEKTMSVNGLRVEPVNKKSSPFLKKEEEISENKKTHDKKAATNGIFRASR